MANFSFNGVGHCERSLCMLVHLEDLGKMANVWSGEAGLRELMHESSRDNSSLESNKTDHRTNSHTTTQNWHTA